MILLLKNLLFTVIAPGTVAVYLPLVLTRGREPASGITLAGSLILFFAGSIVYGWCVWDFATFGRGTPAPIDAPKRLVVRGLYRYTRNPMYVGVLTVILGWTVLYRHLPLLIYAAVVFCGFQLMIVLYEERRLSEQFGAAYDEYRAKVGRWLL